MLFHFGDQTPFLSVMLWISSVQAYLETDRRTKPPDLPISMVVGIITDGREGKCLYWVVLDKGNILFSSEEFTVLKQCKMF